MSTVVIDASAALALLTPTQSTAASDAFGDAPPARLTAPAVFSIEVRHGLLRLERRGLLPVGALDLALADLESEVGLAPAPNPLDLGRITDLARRESLGMYDALYLDLALEGGTSLASRDGSLLAAAARCSVVTIDLR